MSECTTCQHPVSHHSAGECWTDANGREIWDDVPGQCNCAWVAWNGELTEADDA